MLLLEIELIFVSLSLQKNHRTLCNNDFHIIFITHTDIINIDFSKKFNNFSSKKYNTFHYQLKKLNFIVSVYFYSNLIFNLI